jgi:clathrin heavy chain
MRNNTPIDAGLPHPKKNILAFRAIQGDNNVVQIFDLTGGQRKKIKDVKISGKYAYWSWANDDILGFVTDSSVYHLDLTQGLESSSKMMDRRANMVGA